MPRKMTLRELGEALHDRAAVLAAVDRTAPRIVERAVKDVTDRMAAGEQPDRTPQPPIKRPRRSKNTGPPLVDFQSLMKSVSGEVTADGRLILRAFGPGARRHQAERPFLGLSGEASGDIAQLILGGILEGVTTG